MFREISCLLLVLWTLLDFSGGNDLPPPCNSTIYCQGPLLHTVQMAMIYQDSKTFVDLKMKYPPDETMKKFYNFMEEFGALPDRFAVEMFVNKTFEPAGSEFEEWIPEDWIENPRFLNSSIKDPLLRDWGLKLNRLWKLLGRKMKNEVYEHQDLYSIIWVPHPVIVPGGRFREFYYWDSYWIIKGLMLSDMHSTARGMLENFMFIVEKYGFIPNGGRIYYTRRSQPPLLIPMVQAYFEYTHDLDFLRHTIGTMEKEFNFWLTNHTISVEKNGKKYTLAIYGDQSSGPRPESYREDIESAAVFNTPEKKEAFYSELKAAAESGWDFSSRWFILNGTNKGNLTNLNTRSIIPVDLNAIMYGNAIILAQFNQFLNNATKVEYYERIAQQWLDAVENVLWHDDVGVWLDYDLINQKRRNYFYPTNLSPLWTKCYDNKRIEYHVRHIIDYLKKNKMTDPQGGVPSSYEHTGEQWDFPNAWPPLQHMMIVGLNSTGDLYAQSLAFELAEMWMRSNFKAFEETNAMFEKYDASVFGGYGGGGEYEIQLGFGWSNGVVLDLLNMYGDRLTVEEEVEDEDLFDDDLDFQREEPPVEEYHNNVASTTTFSQVVTGLLALLVSLTTGFIGIAIYKKRTHSAATSKSKVTNRNHYTELRNIPKKSKNFR